MQCQFKQGKKSIKNLRWETKSVDKKLFDFGLCSLHFAVSSYVIIIEIMNPYFVNENFTFSHFFRLPMLMHRSPFSNFNRLFKVVLKSIIINYYDILLLSVYCDIFIISWILNVIIYTWRGKSQSLKRLQHAIRNGTEHQQELCAHKHLRLRAKVFQVVVFWQASQVYLQLFFLSFFREKKEIIIRIVLLIAAHYFEWNFINKRNC